MLRKVLLASVAGLVMLGASAQASTQATGQSAPATAAATAAWQDGLFGVRLDREKGRVLARLSPPDAEGVIGRYLYQPGLSAGLGMDNAGLDRSGLGQTQIVAFHKVGGRVFARFENHRFRAFDASDDEQRAVAASFAPSTVWATDVIETGADGSVVVDLSGFLTRDAVNIAGRLKRASLGSFKAAQDLGHLALDQTLVFPDNVELQTVQTFTSDEPGGELSRIAPDSRAVTLTVQHSFIRLPDDGFQTVPHDPRGGSISQAMAVDFAAPLDQPVMKRMARRFRLEKTDPSAARSPVKKPIVFYVDRAAPIAIREALIEGGNWWAQAFEEAGYQNAFRVEVLPEGAHPMDARYSIIAWVHRETRGWSTGSTVSDPRTGEIVRGVVQLGSLRDRQDKMIIEGLVGAARAGTGAEDDPDRLAYHRLRHLSAHEIGHSIGLAHNFAASTYEGRASVMDYPAPWVIADGDRLDFSQAYTTGVGAWDRYAIDWLYGDTPGQDPQARRLALAAEAQAKGYRFVGDSDTRPLGSLQPYGAMWDNGEDPVAEFANTMAVRRIALSRFGLGNLPAGAPAADLRRVIVPIYLYHRYQTTAVGRQIGGVDYSYAVSGAGHERAEVVPADKQRAALEALMQALSPAELDLRDDLIDLLSSAQSGNPDRQTQIELFEGKTDAVFDPSSAAAAATEVVFETLLAPERLNRLIEQQRRDPGQLGLVETLDRVALAVGPGAALNPRQAELRRVARARYAAHLSALMQGKDLSSTAQGVVRDSARRFGEQLKRCRGDRLETAQCAYLADALTGPVEGLKALSATLPVAQPVPPGAPIGGGEWH
ncbi:zinc-dependent metalloprotease [Brevundimonas diminuta]|uniref:zinc-dependent metalloprotease n=1 Tax=Brevundimonas diminuta TaxID=293 RepID=UPI002096FD6B|nr:zinc-dependent metalloprotease [Brevundimonas diminuta]MCO8019343.1 zinc-dependent metalloprotease [Brevundimonas diminuta]MCO8022021.1 zinc-dependent metalloprotease [Brevundimonas diminuta]